MHGGSRRSLSEKIIPWRLKYTISFFFFFFKWLLILTAFLKPEGILKMWLEEAPIQRLVPTEFPQPQGKVRIGIFFFILMVLKEFNNDTNSTKNAIFTEIYFSKLLQNAWEVGAEAKATPATSTTTTTMKYATPC